MIERADVTNILLGCVAISEIVLVVALRDVKKELGTIRTSLSQMLASWAVVTIGIEAARRFLPSAPDEKTPPE